MSICFHFSITTDRFQELATVIIKIFPTESDPSIYFTPWLAIKDEAKGRIQRKQHGYLITALEANRTFGKRQQFNAYFYGNSANEIPPLTAAGKVYTVEMCYLQFLQFFIIFMSY